METCQAFYEALVDFDLHLTQTTIDVFERRIPEKMLENPETSPVETLRRQLKEIQSDISSKLEIVQEAGRAEDMYAYIDKLQARLRRIDTLRCKVSVKRKKVRDKNANQFLAKLVIGSSHLS